MHHLDSDRLSQAELGRALGISPASVTKNKKLGMPTHSVQAAEQWRSLNVRMDMRARSGPKAVQVPQLDAIARDAEAAIQAGAFGQVEHRLREALRSAGPADDPRFSWAVWVALTRYFMHEDFDPDACLVGGLLSADEFALIVSRVPRWGRVWLDAACDWDGYAANGWPPDTAGA